MADSTIHPTAIVEDGARLGVGCVVHAYAWIGRHCVLDNEVVVHPFAAVGGPPQDLRFDQQTLTEVHIGARTVIREHVTVHRATKPGEATRIGADSYLMASSHIGHDCTLGNRVIIASGVLLGGHVHIDAYAFLGGGVAVHQFVRIGESAIIGGGCRVANDVAPFCMATNRIHGLNRVGLRRRGFQRDVVAQIKLAFQEVAVGNRRELASAALASGRYTCSEAKQFLEFFLAGRRGFAPMRRKEHLEQE